MSPPGKTVWNNAIYDFNNNAYCFGADSLNCDHWVLFWLLFLLFLAALPGLFAKRQALRRLSLWFILFSIVASLIEIFASSNFLGPLSVLSWGLLTFSSMALVSVLVAVLLADRVELLRKVIPRKWGVEFLERAIVLSLVPFIAATISIWHELTGGLGAVSALERSMKYCCRAGPPITARYPSGKSYYETLDPVRRQLFTDLSLDKGVQFKGHAAWYLTGPSSLWREYSGKPFKTMSYAEIEQARGVFWRFMEFSLWWGHIPTYGEYGQWITRQIRFFERSLMLATPNDQFYRDHMHLHKFDPGILHALGVRYVLSESSLKGRGVKKMVNQTPNNPNPEFHINMNLYELEGANLANFYPTRFMQEKTAAKAASAIRRHTEELGELAVLFDNPPLVEGPALRSMLFPVRDGFSVVAESDGISAILLPIQFSHCLKIVEHGKNSNKK